MGMGWGGGKGSTGERKAGCSTKICFVPWQRVRRGHSREPATELGLHATGELDLEEWRER